MPRGSLIPREWRAAAAVALLLALATLLPYLYGWRVSPRGFGGLLPYGAQDGIVYLSWMRESADGAWVIRNRFTTDPQQPLYVNLLYQGLGRLAALAGGSPAAHLILYHGARVLLAAVFLLLVYLLAAEFYPRRRERLTALLLAGTASGLGWLAAWAHLPPGLRPLDYAGALPRSPQGAPMPLVVLEAVPFLSFLHYPHFALALALSAAVLLLVTRALRGSDLRHWAGAGAAGFFLANAYTYSWGVASLTLALVVAGIALRRRTWPRAELLGLSLFAVLSLPAAAYQAFVVHADPLWQHKAAYPTLTPSPLRLLLTLGPLAALAAPGTIAAWRSGESWRQLLPLWLLATAGVIYGPFAFQRRMLEGALTVLAILAAPALSRLPRGAVAALLAALALSNVLFVGQSMTALRDARARPRQIYPPVVLYPDEASALDWLNRHARHGNIVLCFPVLGGWVPARTALTVYVGHWGETPEYERRQGNVAAVLNPASSDRARAIFLHKLGARYLLIGDVERRQGYRPELSPFLARRWQEGSTAVYEVVR